MQKTKNILLIDDHPFIIDAYINMLDKLSDQFTYFKANNCQEAYHIIVQEPKIDLAIIDFNVPAYPEQQLLNGKDLAHLISKNHQLCKLVMLTMHQEMALINNILKSVKPCGFISKNDIDFNTFPEIIEKILKHQTYLSKTILEINQNFIKKTLNWDETDTSILIFLEKGIKTKDLPEHINMSLSALEKRKATLKLELVGNRCTDKELIAKAKELEII